MRSGHGITQNLGGPAKWTYYYLYAVMDIFSRYVVGWMVASKEKAAHWQRNLLNYPASSRELNGSSLSSILIGGYR